MKWQINETIILDKFRKFDAQKNCTLVALDKKIFKEFSYVKLKNPNEALPRL